MTFIFNPQIYQFPNMFVTSVCVSHMALDNTVTYLNGMLKRDITSEQVNTDTESRDVYL